MTCISSRGVYTIKYKQVVYFTQLYIPGSTCTYVGVSNNAWRVVMVKKRLTCTDPGVEVATDKCGMLRLQLFHNHLQVSNGLGFSYVLAQE